MKKNQRSARGPARTVRYGLMILAGGVVSGGMVACGEAKRDADFERSATQQATPARPVPVRVVVGLRPDGLTYAPLAKEPFTGEATTYFPNNPWMLRRKETYLAGRREGDTVDYFPDGKVQKVQRFREGKPVSAASWHENGRRETTVELNGEGGTGRFFQWRADGSREVEAGVDRNVHWHGDYRKWSAAGELIAHYRFEHGVLRVILQETPEALTAREQQKMPLVPKEPAAAPPAAAVAAKPPAAPPAKPAAPVRPAARAIPRGVPTRSPKAPAKPAPAPKLKPAAR
jgi:hypothetical protein